MAEQRKPRVYIAGPVSKGDLKANIKQADEAFFALLFAGFAPFCPHWSVYAGSTEHRKVSEANAYTSSFELCAIASALPNGGPARHSTTHQDWLGIDLPWVECADALLRLPGESRGADAEVAHAKAKDIPVFYDVQSLIEMKEAL